MKKVNPRKLRRFLAPSLFILGSSFLIAAFIYLAFDSSSLKDPSTTSKNSHLSFVLVNEDTGANFNGQKYALGTNFVNLVNQSTTESWTTAPLDIANSGFNSGVYDVEIILPQDFSSRLLNLTSFTPDQAQITYKVKPGQSQASRDAIVQKMGTILAGFNQKIIQMYFSSVLNNLFDAQRNVQAIASTANDNTGSLSGKVFDPFKILPGSLDATISNAQNLAQQNNAWELQQNAFTKQTSDTLTQAAENFQTQIQSLEAYIQEQEKLAGINYGDAQNAISAQWNLDSINYFNQYQTMFTDSSNQFGLFGPATPDHSTTLLNQLYQSVANVQSAQSNIKSQLNSAITDLQNQNSALQNRNKDLKALLQEISVDYFNGTNPEQFDANNTQSLANVKAALVKLVDQNVLNQSNSKLPAIYLNSITDLINQSGLGNIEVMLSAMKSEGVLSQTDFDKYTNEFSLIQKFAGENNLNLNSSSFQFLTAQNDTNPASLSFSGSTAPRVTLNFDSSKTTYLTVGQTQNGFGYLNHGEVTFTDASAFAVSLQSSLNQQVGAYGYQSSVTTGAFLDPNLLQVSFSPLPAPSASTSSSTTASSSPPVAPPSYPPLPQVISVSPDVNLTWNLSGAEQKQSYNQISYAFYTVPAASSLLDLSAILNALNPQPGSIGSLSSYADMSKTLVALKQDMATTLLPQLQALDQGARQIVDIYGSASAQGQDITTFASLVANSPQSSLAQLAMSGSGSVFASYDNISVQEKLDLISDALAKNYASQGLQLYQELKAQDDKLVSTISEHQTTITTITNINNDSSMADSATGVLHQIDQAKSWYENAMNILNQDFKAWKQTAPIGIKQVESQGAASEGTNADTNIYKYDQTGQNLKQQFDSLIGASRQQAQSTQSAAAKITSLQPQFDALSKETAQVKGNASDILNHLTNSVSNFSSAANSSGSYAEVFKQVMQNARVGGADNLPVYNFLSNPLEVNGVTGALKSTSIVPYLMTVIGSLMALSFGSVGLFTKRKVSSHEVDYLANRSLPIKNRIPTLVLVSLALIAASIFAVMTQHLAASSEQMTWLVFTILSVGSGILWVAYLVRQVPKVAFLLIGALFGSYALFTPTLGIHLSSTSPLIWLQRLSPLQNLENGFNAMTNGVGIGWMSFGLLGLALVLGIILNLFVIRKEKK